MCSGLTHSVAPIAAVSIRYVGLFVAENSVIPTAISVIMGAGSENVIRMFIGYSGYSRSASLRRLAHCSIAISSSSRSRFRPIGQNGGISVLVVQRPHVLNKRSLSMSCTGYCLATGFRLGSFSITILFHNHLKVCRPSNLFSPIRKKSGPSLGSILPISN